MLKKIASAALALALFLGLAGITLAAPVYPNTARQGRYAGQLSIDAVPPERETLPTPEAAPAPAATPTPEPTPEPEPEPSNFYLNGQPVYGMTLRCFDGVPYCSIRVFFENALAQAEVTWAEDRAQVRGATAGGEDLSLTARPGDCWLKANERCLYVEHEVKMEDDVTMAPLSVLTSVFQESSFTYDEQAQRAEVTLGERLLLSAAEFYNAADLDLIARVIYHEARYEPMVGKVALGNVITNRVAHKKFPNNVYDVLHARNQFTVVNRSVFWSQTPNEACYNAAKLALEGTTILPTAVYYNVKGMNSWAARNRPLVGTIGNHSFYSE